MDAGMQLRRTVAGFFNVEEGQVGPSFSLQSSQGSIARAALDAAIRRGAGLKSQAVYTAKTFGELAADLGLGVDGDQTPTVVISPSTPPIAMTSASGLASCGVDIELVEHLPVVDDPWEDAFYRTNFSPSEIAYCVRQPEPALHFAARWCAKEALKKCDRAFLTVEGKDVEVAHDEGGAPHLFHLPASGPPRRLPHAVSLSHTTQSAVAMVVRVQESSPPATVAAPAPAAPLIAPIAVAGPPSPPRPARSSRLLLVINLIALGLASAALYRTFPGLR